MGDERVVITDVRPEKRKDECENIRRIYEKYKNTALNDLANMGINNKEEDYITETWRAIKADLRIKGL